MKQRFLQKWYPGKQCCGSENFFFGFGFGSKKNFSDSDLDLDSNSDSDSDTNSDSTDIYFGTNHSKVFFQWPTNTEYNTTKKNFNCKNMFVFSFNSSICHALLLNYSVWIRIRIRIRIRIFFFGFGSGKKFRIRIRIRIRNTGGKLSFWHRTWHFSASYLVGL
jgi:hypothetical protein